MKIKEIMDSMYGNIYVLSMLMFAICCVCGIILEKLGYYQSDMVLAFAALPFAAIAITASAMRNYKGFKNLILLALSVLIVIYIHATAIFMIFEADVNTSYAGMYLNLTRLSQFFIITMIITAMYQTGYKIVKKPTT